MPQLTYTDANGQSHAVEVRTSPVTLGRHSSCDLVLSNALVSRRHALLEERARRWYLTDLSSLHGTFLNGERVSQTVTLKDGDLVQIGEIVLSFALGDAVARAEVVPGPIPAYSDHPPERTKDGVTNASGREEIVAERSVDSSELLATVHSVRGISLQELMSGGDRVVEQLKRRDSSSPVQDKGKGEPSLVTGHLLALLRIIGELSHCSTVQQVCDTATEMAMSSAGAFRGVIALRQGERLQPVTQRTGGAEPSAATVRVSRTFVDRVMADRVALIALDTTEDVNLSGAQSVAAIGIRSIMCTPLFSGEEMLGYLYLDSTDSKGRRFRSDDLDFVIAVAHHAASEIMRLRLAAEVHQSEERRRHLSRFLSDDVIRYLETEEGGGAGGFAGSVREQVVTILFADIRGFTAMAESMTPSAVEELLADYFEQMTDVILAHGGTLDKYIGDGIMALFGAPFSKGAAEDAQNAVQAAVAMQAAVADLRARHAGLQTLEIRVGINTGRVLAGTLGTERRREYTVLGDAVNVASRLERACEPGRILVGEGTQEILRGRFNLDSAGALRLKNRTKPVNAWWVSDPIGKV